MMRRRDIPPEDQYGTGRGQSYRPGNVRERTPPRMDSYRARSPPRRADYHDIYKADTYRASRPRSRSPPRRDDFRRRSPSPPRYRDREMPRGGDSYRGRPRSPLPPRREELPRDDLFRREPARDDRDFRDVRDYRDDRDRGYAAAATGRSPLPRFRDRSPVPLKRGREPSPISSRGRRTPPPVKRERLASPPRAGRYDEFPPSRAVSPPRRRFSPDPRDRRPSPPRGVTRDYRLHSRSPLTRNDRIDPRAVEDWRRPRSPLRDSRHDYISREESAVNSAATSRRSSPPVHPSRMALQTPALEERPRSSRMSPRDPYDTREPYRAGDEPKPRNTPMAPPETLYDDERSYQNGQDSIPPPREPRREEELPRAPPTGPSSQRTPSTSMAPPTGPAAVSAPSGPRATGVPPSGPRGAPAPRGDFAPRGRGSFGADFAPRGRGGFGGGSFRGGRGGAPPTGPGFGRGETGFGRGDTGYGRGDAGYGRGDSGFGRGESFSQDPSFASRVPPSGPRSSFSQVPPPTFRQNSSSAAATPTQPRAQRFANGDSAAPEVPTGPKAARAPPTGPAAAAPVNRPHPALADLPKIIDGGQKAEPLVDRSKLTRLEDEAEKLRKQIEDKETRKRKSLREWDRMTRETEAAALRSELAEEALRQLNGEAESQAAF